MIVYKGKLLKKSSNRKSKHVSCQRGSLHGFQTQHFICDQFGCKLWLLSIQNHARHRFQAFARRHLKSLCSSILIRRPFLTQVVDLIMLLCSVCTGFDSEHTVLFLRHIFTQRPMNDRKIEQCDGRCFGRQQLLANSIENFISHFLTHCCPISTKH